MTINNGKKILATISAGKYNMAWEVDIQLFIYVVGKKLKLVKCILALFCLNAV